MQPIARLLCFVTILFLLLLLDLSEAVAQTNNKDETLTAARRDTTPVFRYDPAMEPLTVGAKFIKKIADTLDVKMYEFTLKPGDSAMMHAHPDHTVYVLQGGKLAVTFKGMGRQIMDLKTGTGFVSGSLSDALRNVGATTVTLLVTDIYRPSSEGRLQDQ